LPPVSFVAGVVDTDDKLQPLSLTLMANLPQVSTALAKLVAKLPLMSLIPVVHLD
jgi:hypothetical protein